jgi:hypothetical protein
MIEVQYTVRFKDGDETQYSFQTSRKIVGYDVVMHHLARALWHPVWNDTVDCIVGDIGIFQVVPIYAVIANMALETKRELKLLVSISNADAILFLNERRRIQRAGKYKVGKP